MKIDIRDYNQTKIDGIIFADNGQSVDIHSGFIDIDCHTSSLENAQVKTKDIPNLIKALKKVCELKGIDHE